MTDVVTAPSTTSYEDDPEAVITGITVDLGGSLGVLLTALGVRHRIFAEIRSAGAVTPGKLARRTGLPVPSVREWLRSQAAAGFVAYDGTRETFRLPEGVAVALFEGPGAGMIDCCADMLCSIASSSASSSRAERDKWSGRRESNSRYQLGKLKFCH